MGDSTASCREIRSVDATAFISKLSPDSKNFKSSQAYQWPPELWPTILLGPDSTRDDGRGVKR